MFIPFFHAKKLSFRADILTPKILKRSFLVIKLLCTIAFAGAVPIGEAAGPLSVSTNNPRYFFNSNGAAVYLGGIYLNEYNLLNGATTFSAHLDHLQQHNHNFTRVWAWEQSPWFLSDNGGISFTNQPYERTGPGLASDGGLKFDLTRFNQAYFDQLRSRVIAAGERGIYVSVMLFEGFSSQKRVRQVNPWLGDPFELANNINGINGDPNRNGGGEEFFSLAFPSIVTLQEVFVSKIIDTLNDLDNVLYEVSGNGVSDSLAWQYHMIDYIKRYQRSKANQHPVGISQFKVGKFKEVLNSSADWIVVAQTDDDLRVPRANKVIVVEPNLALLESSTAHRWVWRHFTAGYNLVHLKPASSNRSVNRRVDTAIGQSISYSEIVNLAAMSPSKKFCSNEYCLANPAEEYLTYLPGGGAVTVDLSGTDEKFIPAWFAAATGETFLGDTVAGGKSVRLTSPLHEETVLHLVKERGIPISNPNDSDEAPAALPPEKTGELSGIVATPVITPNGGIYSGQVSVTLKTSTPGASIYYTTDGQPATESSRKYTGPFTLTSSTFVKAKAFKSKLQPSAEVAVWFSNASVPGSFSFNMSNSGNVAVAAGSSATNTITAALTAGTSQTVAFSASGIPSGTTSSFSATSCKPNCSTIFTIGTTISTPTGNYPIIITASGGGVVRTTALTLSVTAAPAVAMPTITPNGGSFTGSVPVNIQTSTAGASIHYTTNGSTPSQSSTLYAGPINLTSSAVIKAKAFKNGYTVSAEASASFTISQPFNFASSNSGDKLVDAGSTITNTIAATLISGNSQTVSFSASGLPSGAMASFSPTSCIATCSTVLSISTTASTPAGTFPIVTTSSGGGVSKTSTFNLVVRSLPANPTVTADSIFAGYTTSPIDDGIIDASGGTASTWASAEDIGSDHWINISFPSPRQINSAIIHWAYNTYRQTYMTAQSVNIQYWNGSSYQNVSSVVHPGSDVSSSSAHFDTVTTSQLRFLLPAGQGNPIYPSVFWITEVDYGLDIVPPTVAAPTITPNGGSFIGSVPVTIQTATAGASIYYTTNGSPPTQSSTLYTGPINLTSSTVLKAKAFKNGSSASAEASASFTATQPFDFSLSNDGNKSVVAGSSVTSSISAALVSGSSTAVSFSVSGLPAGATASFSVASCTPACTTTLAINTSATTPATNSIITVSAAGGGLTQTAAFSLSVINGPATVPSNVGAVFLTWTDASSDETGFKIERLVDGSVDSTLTVPADITSFTDSGLASGKTYCYRVQAFNATSVSDSSNEACSIADHSLATLTVNSAAISTGGTIKVTWNGITTPSPNDWIGLYTPGSADTDFIDWMYVSCSKTAGNAWASGSCSYVLPSTLPAGNYELRLFVKDMYLRLVTSKISVGALTN